jgi:hypothetical protein
LKRSTYYLNSETMGRGWRNTKRQEKLMRKRGLVRKDKKKK